jgi:hypothetical protein
MEHDPNFVPVMDRFGNYRTPLWEYSADGEYSICVGTNIYRYFTEKTLPAEVKGILGMVKAFPYEERIILFPEYDGDLFYYIAPSIDQEDIGWRVKDNIYIVILNRELLAKVSHGRYARKKS